MASTSNQIKLFPVTPTHHISNICSKGLDLPSKNKQTSVLELGRDCIDRCLEILEWRTKTFLPVIKPARYELNPQHPLSPFKHQHITNRFPQHFQKTSVSTQPFESQMKDQSDMKRADAMYEVLVQIQDINFLLSNIKLLSFPQVVYLLKEMMIGYEVLVGMFGIFEPSDQMIAVNGANQWKLWVNCNFTMNAIAAQNMSEKEFIYKLILIAEKHCLETTLSKRFFMELKEITYSQECSFVRVLQRIKQFAVNNKVYTVNTVILPKEQSIQEKTLKKQKGYNRIEQLKSSLIDGRFIPKQIWTYKTQKNDPSVCSIGDLDASPAKKVESMRDKHNSCTNDNQLSTAWKTHSQLHDFLTPREKNNSNAVHLYSPQILGQTQKIPVLQNKQAVSPRLSFTISNSLIERRRRSDQVKCTAKFQTVKLALTERNNPKEMDENQYQLKRQMATKNLNLVDCRQSKQIDLMNSCNKSPSTEIKESQAERCSMAYKNLKKNDFQACGKTRNNHSGFINISIPIYHHSNNKNLSISYQFKTQNEQKEKEQQQGSDPPISQQWKNTISGLFSDTATVRELKTSIKIKTPKDKKQVRKFLSDVNLEILSKMGRQANDSFDEDEEQNRQYLQIKQLKLAEQSIIFKNGPVVKDEEQDEVLRKPSSSGYTIPNIVVSGPPKYKVNVCI